MIEFPHIFITYRYTHHRGGLRATFTDQMTDNNRVNMEIYCKNCRATVRYCSNPLRSRPEYGVLRCTVGGCCHQIAICTFCDKRLSIRGNDFRRIKVHIREQHEIMLGVKDDPVDHDGSNNNDGDDFEVNDAPLAEPTTIGWPRHGSKPGRLNL